MFYWRENNMLYRKLNKGLTMLCVNEIRILSV